MWMGLHSERKAARGPELTLLREKYGSITPRAFLFSFYRLPEMIWQSLKINELYSFFPSEFCFEGIL